MKIGIVTEYYYPTLGGIQEHVHHFAITARRAGHEVAIITPAVHDSLASVTGGPANPRRRAQDDEQNGVIRVGHSIPLLSGGSIARISVGGGLGATLAEILGRERFDVLHMHSPLMPTLPLLALRASNCTNVATFHSIVGRSLLFSAFRPLLQRYMDRLDAAIGVSETALRGVQQYFTAPWHVVPNGVDVATFSAGRRRPEFDDGRLNLLHVGRFDPRNGVDRVIKAWVGVKRAGVDARLLLVGDGPLRPLYESMVPSDLRGDAHFIGFVASSERSSYYASGDVLLCPAVGGTFGIIVLEAMAAGCAIVAADTPGFRHIVQDGVQGFLVDVSRDPQCVTLAARTRQLLTDGVLRRRCATSGRRTAALFDWSAVTTRVLNLYRSLQAGASSARQLDS